MGKKVTLADLRDHLFETIELVKDEESSMTETKAKVVATLAQTIINSANTELKYMEMMEKTTNSDFFPELEEKKVNPNHKRLYAHG